jgi:hypothetical protein
MDNVPVDNTRNGWSGKLFEVQSFKFAVDSQNDTLGYDLVLQETAREDYDWDSGSEISVDPAPNTNLPDVFTVGQIIGLGINSIPVETRGGDTTYRAQATWTAIENAFVANGGWIHFRYRLSGAIDWNQLSPVPGNSTKADIFSGALGTNYDLQVWLENSEGIIGDTVDLDNLSLGSAGGVGSTDDYGEWVSSPGTTDDWGDWTSSPGSTEDWGGFA